MRHATAHIGVALKTARQAEGISQRVLSEKAGVPQGHISKIENGTVDLRVSSLVALARVLDLELTLVPRKSVPAVNSIVRSTASGLPQRSAVTRKGWRAVLTKLDELSHAYPANMELAQLQRLTRDLQHLGFSVVDRETLRDVNKRVDAVLQKRDFDGIHRLLLEFKSLRNAAAHSIGDSSVTKVRPAYSLEEDDHGG